MRGVAVLLVMLAHVNLLHATAGNAGVTLFFVLSGFLITALLCQERHAAGRIDLRAFYLRRGLRLLPALAMMLAAVCAYELVFGDPSDLAVRAGAVAFYVANWVALDGHPLGPLRHTWSLAVEEQFYILWPIVLILVRRWQIAFTLAVCGAALSIAERLVVWDGSQRSAFRVYYGTDGASVGLLLGCALALWLTAGRRLPVGRLTAVTGVALLVYALSLEGMRSSYVTVPIIAAVAGVMLLAYLMSGTGRGRALCLRPLRQTGRISYGMYLWHVPILWVIEPRIGGVLLAVVCFPLTYAVALLSWRWVEQPFLKVKVRLSARSDLIGEPRPDPLRPAVRPVRACHVLAEVDRRAVRDDLHTSRAS